MTTTYTFDQLKEDVRKEAEALRVHATKEERGRLDIDDFDPQVGNGCIYGLIAGDCFSERAANLIELCTPRYFKNDVLPDVYGGKTAMDHISKNVNGCQVEDFVKERTRVIGTHFSAIEAYITLSEARNKNLIAYLRGETETLEL